jgi:hypothetical protein
MEAYAGGLLLSSKVTDTNAQFSPLAPHRDHSSAEAHQFAGLCPLLRVNRMRTNGTIWFRAQVANVMR